VEGVVRALAIAVRAVFLRTINDVRATATRRGQVLQSSKHVAEVPFRTRRHAHLVGEVTRPSTRKGGLGLPFARNVALAALILAALAAAGTAFAISAGLRDFDGFFEMFDEGSNDSSIPRLVGDRAVITRGDDWAFVGWKSTRGLCTSVVVGDTEGATTCGLPVLGAPQTSGRQHFVAGGMYQQRPEDDVWVQGVASANVSRVDIELTDGRRLQAPLYDAPAALGLNLKFFLVRTRPRDGGATPVGIPTSPVGAIAAYDDRGQLLERSRVPQP